ncbi:ORF6C domain-containing protein [Terrisporobacter petrolearius]|uniref:ORF6C domain-containing protein n=1 Tax=Terrisporobacter petrolearius TaxID=1460447 RepID=UPI0031CC9723
MNSSLYASYKVMEINEEQAVKTIPSYEVSEMMETKHSKVIRMIEGDEDRVGIIPTLRKAQMGVSKYFIESTYKVEGNNKTYKCYECTKLGCDMLANKMTGEKGILFTAKYVERFNEMVENPFLNASKELQAIFMIDRKQQVIESRVGAIEEKMTVDYELAENLRTAVNTRAVHLLEGKYSEAYKKLSKKLFSELYRDIKGAFKVNSYKNISLKNYDKALSYIEKWKPSLMLQYAIQGANGQVKLDEMECVTNG